jgi:predicted ATP-grasp superfamily ATP-dependent carboligase
MRVFVYESVTASDDPTLPASLRAEGQAMREAILEDFRRIPYVQAVTTDDALTFPALARPADYTLVIAPELDGQLFALCRQVETDGGQLLGPTSHAVALTADKLRLAEHLIERGVRTLRTTMLGTYAQSFPVVCKPRDGAGSVNTFLVHSEAELLETRRIAGRELVVQPYVVGQPASVAFLVGPKQTLPLLPAAQQLSTDGRFRYLGGSIPLPPELARRAISVATPAVQEVEGLRGYVGVDVVLGDEGDWVIEINPRLTTSYIGLRALCRENLAEAMLHVVRGEKVELSWKNTRLRCLGGRA